MLQELDYFGKIKAAILDLGKQLDGDYVKKELSGNHEKSYERFIDENGADLNPEHRKLALAHLRRTDIVMGAVTEAAQKHGLDIKQVKMLVAVLSDSIGQLIQGEAALIPARSAVLRLDELKAQLINRWQKHGDHYVIFPEDFSTAPAVASGYARAMEKGWGKEIKRVIASIVGNARSAHMNADFSIGLEESCPEYRFEGKGEGIAVTPDGLSKIEEVLGIKINLGRGQAGGKK